VSVIPIERGQDVSTRCLALYERGLPSGDSTGWPTVDEHFTVSPKQWTLVTGIPGSGKSEWVDALAMNLMEALDWHFAFYSPENFPTEVHLAKLAEKRLRKPFARGPTERMTEGELHEAMEFVTQRALWLAPKYKNPMALLDAADEWRKYTTKPFAVVLDPWNSLEHLRPDRMSETEYVSETLSLVTDYCRANDCHVFIVAHPAKLQRDASGKRPVPSPYDISGSAHWYNKADNIITVHRDQVDGGQDVEIHVQKVRFKHIGRIGVIRLKYDRIVGRYFEAPWAIAGESYKDPERPNPAASEDHLERVAIQSELRA
jgi:twinkle protein